jgi:hypothetical protein
MSGKGKISILVMREDAGVKRLKISPGMVRFVLWFLFCLIAAGGLAGYAAYYYWGAVSEVQAENAAMSEEVSASKSQLVKLANLESILENGDQTELSTLLGSYNADAAGLLECEGKKTDAVKTAPEVAQEKECPKLDLRSIFDKVDLNLAGVDNFKAAINDKYLRISFDLSNVSPQTALSGDAECMLLTNNGDLTPLKTKREDLNFQIQRFKQVTSNSPLPPKVEIAEIYGVKMVIKGPDGKVIFSNIYPLSKN